MEWTGDSDEQRTPPVGGVPQGVPYEAGAADAVVGVRSSWRPEEQEELFRLRFIIRLIGTGRMSEGLDGLPATEAEVRWREIVTGTRMEVRI